VADELPPEASLLDLGEHRLKDLERPEHIFQLVHPDLAADFPPLATLDRRPNNLPAQATALIGRETELSEIMKRLDSAGVRLMTLTGPGGIGKTRLALQAAAELIDSFPDGVFFVDLAPIRDAGSVATAIAQTLSLRETSNRPLLEEILAQLRTKSLLLLLDNFEQVMPAATIAVDLLRYCPGVKLLVTSREALRLRGEYVYPIPPLALPQIDPKDPSLEKMTQYEAVRLFIERAQAVKPDFKVTNENAPAVAEICWRLDGLPLAIELAAARVRLFPPQALLERLGSRLQLLRGGAIDLPVRQQTLRDAIDWSYELLAPGEQRLFEMLSVFPVGCTFEAAETTAGELERLAGFGMDILDGLASLVDKSLIRQVERESGEPRLLMLETIREYAAERLAQDPDFSASAQHAHAACYAAFAHSQWDLLTGSRREAGLEALAADVENLRTAWDYWAGVKDMEKLGLLVDSLWLLYDARGWYHATAHLINDLLDILSSTPSTPELAQQEILLQTGLARALLAIKGYTKEVEDAYQRALDLSQVAGEIPQLLPVLRGLSNLHTYLGQHDKGVEIGEKIISLSESQGDESMRAEGKMVLGYNLAFAQDLNLGMEHLEVAVEYFGRNRQSPGRFRIGVQPAVASFTSSGLILWMLGFPDRALERTQESINLAKSMHHPYSAAYALFHKSLLHLLLREAEPTMAFSQATLEIAEEHEFEVWKAVATCLNGAGMARAGQPEEGLVQVRQGIDLYQGLKTPPIFWPLLLYIQAGVCGQSGEPEEGLALLDEGAEIASHMSGRSLGPEFMRARGDLLLAARPGEAAEAEAWMMQGLKVAQELGAQMLELRAALSLCRLWKEQGKGEEGKRILNEAYGKFSEGFATVDLSEARLILEGI
jgi:predicted ATPase